MTWSIPMHTLLQSQPVFQACNGLRDRGLANFEITRSGQKRTGIYYSYEDFHFVKSAHTYLFGSE
jgi:hypothetical protein